MGEVIVERVQLADGPAPLSLPVIVVHNETSPGSQVAVCSGRRFETPAPSMWPTTARWPCSGCALHAAGRVLG